jgi:ferrous iron transport protein B
LVTGWLGLPAQASAAFLMGFLRRDFGATGLFAMQSQGLLTPLQVVVAMVTITLFIPCIASVMMIAKNEAGARRLEWSCHHPVGFPGGRLLNRALLF